MVFPAAFIKLPLDNGTGGALLFRGVDPVYGWRAGFACPKLDPYKGRRLRAGAVEPSGMRLRPRLLELEAPRGINCLSLLSGVTYASSVLGWMIAVVECSASKYLCTRLRPASPGTLWKLVSTV